MLKVENEGRLRYGCRFCPFGTKDMRLLLRHEQGHQETRRLRCRFCSFTSNVLTAITVHERVHTTERIQRCRFCDFTTHHHAVYVDPETPWTFRIDLHACAFVCGVDVGAVGVGVGGLGPATSVG